MAKQASLFNFMSRDTDKTKAATVAPTSINNAPSGTTKRIGKFKFNSRSTSRPQTLAEPLINGENKRNALNTTNDDCVVISDEEHGFSPVKKIARKTTEDDIFANFEMNDLTFTKPQQRDKREIKTMDDLYAKYGTPEAKTKTALDTIDIDKELNSNASYVSAMKKLDEGLEQLRSSPKKTTVGKFKFNTRSKPSTITSDATAKQTTAAKPASTSISQSNSLLFSNKPATITSNSYSEPVRSVATPKTATIQNRHETSTKAETSQSSFSMPNSSSFSTAASIYPKDDSFDLIDHSP